ncbi:MAG: TetR/AcrR family transcriptional regulator [Caldilineaceae bacterium]
MSTNQSHDRRARRTRAALQTALLTLLQKRRLESIQIKEITDLADVSRPAFYLHFESKEELLLSHIDDLFAQLHKAVFADLAQSQPVTLETLVITSFQLWGKEAQAWQVALQIENKDLLLTRLRRHMAALMNEFAAYPGSNITQHPMMHDYIVDFVTGGVYMLLRRWAEEGMKTPADQIGRLAYQLVAQYGVWHKGQR